MCLLRPLKKYSGPSSHANKKYSAAMLRQAKSRSIQYANLHGISQFTKVIANRLQPSAQLSKTLGIGTRQGQRRYGAKREWRIGNLHSKCPEHMLARPRLTDTHRLRRRRYRPRIEYRTRLL
jgi:hypothetical protein